ncbi:uncharacterized protein [Prorops nasuta]|uniref:uncharacterized protein n=1 Tax=Prorops nasuta TaxID=863751 RepID=UPI0034D00950
MIEFRGRSIGSRLIDFFNRYSLIRIHLTGFVRERLREMKFALQKRVGDKSKADREGAYQSCQWKGQFNEILRVDLPRLIFGLGTPLQLDRESVIVGVFTKLLYSLPSNSTDYTEPGVYHTRDSRSRWSIYKIFERAASLYGFGGKECLLKAICQAAATPFDTNHSFFSQLVEIFLRPSSTAEEYDEYGDREYRTAELLGERQGDESCHALYPECRRSVLDVFSTLAT